MICIMKVVVLDRQTSKKLAKLLFFSCGGKDIKFQDTLKAGQCPVSVQLLFSSNRFRFFSRKSWHTQLARFFTEMPLVINCLTRWSLIFIFVFLCWSSKFHNLDKRNIVHGWICLVAAAINIKFSWCTVIQVFCFKILASSFFSF